MLLIENNGPGGYFAEIARTLVLGKASNELIDGFEAMKEAQDYTLSLMKPGASCRDIANAHDDYMKKHGFEPEIRLYAHSQGYDMVERPMIRADETMPIEAQHELRRASRLQHRRRCGSTICDNYMVEANGVGDCLHKTEKKVFEVAEPIDRHGRARPGHPRLAAKKTWMPGTRPGMTPIERHRHDNVMPRLLILLTLPKDVRDYYAARLQQRFPELEIDVVDHFSKATPLACPNADILLTFGPMLRDEVARQRAAS